MVRSPNRKRRSHEKAPLGEVQPKPSARSGAHPVVTNGEYGSLEEGAVVVGELQPKRSLADLVERSARAVELDFGPIVFDQPKHVCDPYPQASRSDSSDLVLSGSVNQRSPSGPAVMPHGQALAPGIGNSAISPLEVIRPILPRTDSVNQRSPSGPLVRSVGSPSIEGRNSATRPLGVICPIEGPGSPKEPKAPSPPVPNQRFPSGPVVIDPSPVE